jgi:hypothetical protein
MTKRTVTESVKKTVAALQGFKCNANIGNYNCPLYYGGRDGTFDEAGYEIDHILELAEEGNNETDNLQALCPMCHRVKTKRKNQLKTQERKQKQVSQPKKKHTIKESIILFNGSDVGNVTKIDISGIGIDLMIDDEKNVYMPNAFGKYRIIGTYQRKKFVSALKAIPEPPKRTVTMPPYRLDETMAIDDWSRKYGFSTDEYYSFK